METRSCSCLHALLLNMRSFWAPLLFLSAVTSSGCAFASLYSAPFPAIFVFGDSLSDAGNAVLSGNTMSLRTTQWPYGMTFPGWPTGRYSDGRTLVDILATHFGLPLLGSYLNSSADFRGGVNYAVGGATALNASFLNSLGIWTVTNNTLNVQLSSHLGLQAYYTASGERELPGGLAKTACAKGLYVLQIGGDDYTHATMAGYSISFVIFTLMPLVIQQIHAAVETLLQSGANNFLLIPVSPLGCMASMLACVDGNKDAYGCLEEYNSLGYLHGVYIKEEVEKLRLTYPNTSFLFMDYYAAYLYVRDRAETFGYIETLNVCCGDRGYPYNFNSDNYCNVESSNVCTNPGQFMSWDGIHFTESFNFQTFNQTLITGTFLDTGFASS